MSDDVRRAAENLREMVGASVDLENASVECVRDMWIVAQDHPCLAQQREEAAGRKLYEDVVARLRSVEELLARGKGEWPKNDYVRDETWATWQGERLALRSVLQSSGFLKCDSEGRDVLHPYSPPARSAGD